MRPALLALVIITVCFGWPGCFVVAQSASVLRNASPPKDFAQVQTPVLAFNISTVEAIGSVGATVNYFPAMGSPGLPRSTADDMMLEFSVMLPHADDDTSACFGPWRTTNEFGQDFSGAFVLHLQSSCTSTTQQMASRSGAAGILSYGCSPSPPTNCDPLLKEIIIYEPVDVPTLSIPALDGERMVAYLQAAKAAAIAAGTSPPKTTLRFRIKSNSRMLIDDERAALLNITRKTTMGKFAGGSIPDILPLWSVEKLTDPAFDPCNRLKGIWCEGNSVVLISFFYQSWRTPHGIPTEFGNLRKLRYLNIQANAWTGPFPDSWCQLTELQTIFADAQAIMPRITALPDCGSNWANMRELRFAHGGFLSMPPNFGKWTRLRHIVMLDNPGLLQLPDMSQMAELEWVDWGQCNFQGAFPTFHPSAPIQILLLGNNKLSGGVSNFDGNTALQVFDINSNAFSGPLPSFRSATNLVTIDVGSQIWQGGGFTGPMPESWGVLNKVTTLYLLENKLSGWMYASLMKSLQKIDVSNNLMGMNLSIPTDPHNTVLHKYLDTLFPQQAVSVKYSRNGFAGDLLSGNFIFSLTIQELFLDHNAITGITNELFVGVAQTVDLSYNNLSLTPALPNFPQGNPDANARYLSFVGNPNYQLDTLPKWMTIGETRIQQPGESFSCAPVGCNTAEFMTVEVDPSFYKWKYCDCARGTFGRPPYCSPIPSFASLNPYAVIASEELSTLSNLLTLTNGVGGALTPSRASTQGVFSQAISDSMYGDNRLTLGMSTSWVFDLTDLYQTLSGVRSSKTSVIPAMSIPVRVISIELWLDSKYFNSRNDELSIYEGDSSLAGNRVYQIRGNAPKPSKTASPHTSSPEYLALYNRSLAQFNSPTLVELKVFSPIATIQFISRDTSGSHFFATYSYQFECPDGYFFDPTHSPAQCRPNRAHFAVGADIRSAVFAVSGLAIIWCIVNIVILAQNWHSPVYKAASRIFMLLTLCFLTLMATGALLYAAIPMAGTRTGDAICVSRLWLCCLPLAGVLSILLAKANRLDSIFGAMTLQVKKTTDFDIFKMVLAVCAIQIGMLALFTGLPLSRAAFDLGKGSLAETLVRGCSAETGFMGWFGGEVALIGCLVLATAYLGFKTRNLPSQYNESSHIQNAVILLAFFGTIICPLDYFIQDTPEAAVLIQGLGQAFLCLMLTTILFAPKLYYLWAINHATTDPGANTLSSPTAFSSEGHSGHRRESLKPSAMVSASGAPTLTPKLTGLPHINAPKPLPVTRRGSTPGSSHTGIGVLHSAALRRPSVNPTSASFDLAGVRVTLSPPPLSPTSAAQLLQTMRTPPAEHETTPQPPSTHFVVGTPLTPPAESASHSTSPLTIAVGHSPSHAPIEMSVLTGMSGATPLLTATQPPSLGSSPVGSPPRRMLRVHHQGSVSGILLPAHFAHGSN